MTKLTLEEAKSLATVFGDVDRRSLTLLSKFHKPRSKYDAMIELNHLPKPFRIPRASLYRKVDQLHESGFLRIVDTETFVRGSLKESVHRYGLSAKGTVAASIFSYILFLDSKTPSHERKESEKLIAGFESLPAWGTIIEALRWHKKMEFDLSHARINYMYLVLTGILPKFDQSDFDDPSTLEAVVALKDVVRLLFSSISTSSRKEA